MSEHTRQEAEMSMDLTLLVGVCQRKYEEGIPVITFGDYYRARCGKKMNLTKKQVLEICLAAVRK